MKNHVSRNSRGHSSGPRKHWEKLSQFTGQRDQESRARAAESRGIDWNLKQESRARAAESRGIDWNLDILCSAPHVTDYPLGSLQGRNQEHVEGIPLSPSRAGAGSSKLRDCNVVHPPRKSQVSLRCQTSLLALRVICRWYSSAFHV